MDKLKALPREQKMYGIAITMVVFIISLFLKWAGTGVSVDIPGVNVDFSISGTDIDSWWIALILAIVAGGIFLAEALNFTLPVKWASLGAGALAACLVFFWALVHLIDLSNLKFGAWLAVIASLVGLVLAAVVWGQERT